MEQDPDQGAEDLELDLHLRSRASGRRPCARGGRTALLGGPQRETIVGFDAASETFLHDRRSSGRYRLTTPMKHAIPALLLTPLLAGTLWGADFKAGFGRRQITPPMPIWMAGFENRTHPAESIAHDIWTKALAIEDAGGQKLIVITVDLATIPRAMTDM